MPKRITPSVFQAHLPFQNRARVASVAVSFSFEKRLFAALGIAILVLIVLYSYFVMMSISHVVVREEFILETERIASEAAELEERYLAEARLLTEDRAYHIGFVPSGTPTFIERGSVGHAGAF